MEIEHTKKLYNDFPILYAQHSESMQNTCMCWGFECPDEWFDIIYELSSKLEEINRDSSNDNCVHATQVKEKFGGLRFYTDTSSYEVEELKDEAEKAVEYLQEDLMNGS